MEALEPVPLSSGWGRRALGGTVLWAMIVLERPLGLSPYTTWLLALPVQLWCAAPFHAGLARGLRTGRADADMLVSVSSGAAFLLGTAWVFLPAGLAGGARGGWLALSCATAVLACAGRRLERTLEGVAAEARERLARRVPRTARALREGTAKSVSAADVSVGERIVVRRGEQIPLDGEVVEGVSRLDESVWTGSGLAVEKAAGARVYAGMVNKGDDLTVSVTRSAAGTALNAVVGSLRKGLAERERPERPSDALARGFLPAAFAVAAAAGLLLGWKGPEPRVPNALAAMAAVLAVCCPWGLTLAAPLAILGAMAGARRKGAEVRNPAVLETLRRPDVIVFDKTGVLTEGRPEVLEIVPSGGWTREQLARFASAAERRSGHPFALALKRWSKEHGCAEDDPARSAASFEAFPGRGVCAVLDSRRVLVGSLSWLSEHGIEPAPQAAAALRSRTDSLIGVAVDGKFAGAVAFGDPLRPGVREAVLRLEAMGVEPVLASGDRDATAFHLAQRAGIGEVHAQALAEDKALLVARLRAEGRRVVVVGRGCRDAPALCRADLGMALAAPRSSGVEAAAGADLACDAADLTLTRHDLDGLIGALRLSLAGARAARANLWWAFAFHVLLIPAAAGALYPVAGVPLDPAYAAVAALGGFLAMGVNYLRLRRSWV